MYILLGAGASGDTDFLDNPASEEEGPFSNKLKKDYHLVKAGFLSKRSQFLAFQKKQPQALIDSINWNAKATLSSYQRK